MTPALTLSMLLPLATPPALPLADFFGFSGMDVIPIGDDPGPMLLHDMNGDGLQDVVIANNRRSRIEILHQRADANPDTPVEQPRDINEFPDHWRYTRALVPVADSVSAMAAVDLDQDGKCDLITGGAPGRVTFLRQIEPGMFNRAARRDIRKLAASPTAFAVADMSGDGHPQLLSVVDGDPAIWPLDGFSLGPIKRYPAGASIAGLVPADYDGDGLLDLAGICPDDAAPVRIWFGRQGPDGVAPGPQTIFEMPPLFEFEAVGHPTSPASRIAVIERAARRIVLYDLEQQAVADEPDRDAAFTVHGFPDPGQRDRAWSMIDIDGDGLSELVAADSRSNAITIFRQSPDGGFGTADSHPSLSDIDGLAAVPATETTPAELLVLSTEEGVVGRSTLTAGDVPFPRPITITAGLEPVAMKLVMRDGRPTAAVLSNEKREYSLDLIDLSDGEKETISIGSLSRQPDHIESLDIDQDGQLDLLLMTRDRPMIVLLADEGGFTKLEKRDMQHYGLVAAANGDNSATIDVTGDGVDELVIADENYLRALRFDRETGGWIVVTQSNAEDPDSKLTSVTTVDGQLVASDKTNDRLLFFEIGEDGDWHQSQTLRLRGFQPGPLSAATLAGEIPAVVSAGEDGFAVVPLRGMRRGLREVGTWRSSLEGHIPHELAVGDINADGYGDMVALDAGEQMMEILTFDQGGDMLHVTGFQVYESQLFQGGESREYQPRQVSIGDVTGDGKHDVVLLVHDRILIYPQ